MRNALIVAAGLVAVVAGPALAHGEEFDVSPEVVGGKIVTNAFQDALEFEVKNVRVFAFEFGEDPLEPYFLEDPGFHPLPGSGFAAGSLVGFNLTSPLQYWDGAGSPAFGALPAGETMSLAFGSSTVAAGSVVPSPAGYNFGLIDPLGEFDDHLNTTLINGALATPTEGIYLLSMVVTSSDSNLLPSEPIYLLFANGELEEQLDIAREYVRDNFAAGSNLPVVPEPSALALIAAASMLGLRRRG